MNERALAATKSGSSSWAARCIQLHFLGAKFLPEYTHQVFEGEIIRGYRPPMTTDEEEAAAPEEQHEHNTVSSAAMKEDSMKELSIKIQLSPSCRKCWLELEMHRPSRKRSLRRSTRRESAAKRPCTDTREQREATRAPDDDKLPSDEMSNERGGSGVSPDDRDEGSSYSEDDDDVEENAEKDDPHQEGHTRRRRMPAAEIIERLSRSLPVIEKDEAAVGDDYLEAPLGYVMEEYECDSVCYCLTLAKGSVGEVSNYHAEIQKLALFFIETADCVNVADESQGSWNILYLFRKQPEPNRYSLAGYMTLYNFQSPLRKPLPGTVVRVCQALLLPPYQRAGHGKRMLTAVYDWADGAYNQRLSGSYADLTANDIVEVNVEDPAPGFTAIRNRVDYQRFLRAKESNFWFGSNENSAGNTTVDQDDFFGLLKESEAVSAATKAKTTTRQAHIMYEIYKLHRLREHFDGSENLPQEQPEALLKRYRLMVKKRLQKWHREDLSACHTKQEMQNFLAKLYDDTSEKYNRILDRLSSPDRTPL